MTENGTRGALTELHAALGKYAVPGLDVFDHEKKLVGIGRVIGRLVHDGKLEYRYAYEETLKAAAATGYVEKFGAERWQKAFVRGLLEGTPEGLRSVGRASREGEDVRTHGAGGATSSSPPENPTAAEAGDGSVLPTDGQTGDSVGESPPASAAADPYAAWRKYGKEKT